MNGWIRIGTKVDSSGVEKGIKAIERKIDQAEREKLVIETNMDKTKVELDEVNTELEKMKSNADALRSKFANVKGNLSYEQLTAKKDYEAMIPTIDALDKKHAKISDTLSKQQLKYDKINAQVDTYKEKIDQIELKQQEKAIKNINTGIGKTVKSVVRWSLAAIGVRSIYAGIRSLLSNVSQYNDQIAGDMQYMGFALSSVFEPIVKTIVNWLYKILGLINQISMVLFGKNLFANAGVDKFQKAMGGAAKSAKEIKNNLAGFDELNVLGSEDSGASGGGGGITTPSMDLSQMSGEVPNWLLWLKEHIWEIVAGVSGLAGALVLLKFGLSGTEALGFGIAIAGIISFIKDLIEYLKDPTFENFGKMIQDLGLIILGFGIAFVSVPAIVIGAITLIFGTLIKYWEDIKAFLDNAVASIYDLGDKISEWILGKLDWIMEKFGYFGVGVAGIIMVLVNTMTGLFGSAISAVMNLFDGLFTGIKQIFDGILMLGDDLSGGLKLIFKGIGNIFIGVLNFIIDAINAFISPLRALIVTAGKVTGNNWTMDDIKIPNRPKLAKGGIVSKPTQAIIGEAGREAVVPLENNTEWLDMLAEKLEGIGTGSINISGKGNWAQFMRFLNFELDKSRKNKGTSFIGGAING